MNRIESTSRSDLDLIAAACSPEATEQQLRALESACAEDEGLAQLYLEYCHFEWVCQLRERATVFTVCPVADSTCNRAENVRSTATFKTIRIVQP